MGLPGEMRITQLPALPSEQDTYYQARRAKHINISFPGRDTLLWPEDMKRYLLRCPDAGWT
jgi:hypothetical protein